MVPPVYGENVSENLGKIIEIKVTHNDLFIFEII